MRKLLFMTVILLVTCMVSRAQLYSTKNGVIRFYASTALENIEAESHTVLAVLNTVTNELAFIIPNNTFSFLNKLMQEHFNEKYIESEKYVNSSFKGKINESVSFKKDGEYPVTVVGKLNIHGVEQDRTLSGMVIVKEGKIILKSEFMVKNADHQIKIPTVVMAKIAEEVKVNVDVSLDPKK